MVYSTEAPTYISFDPGKRTGVVGWNATGVPLFLVTYLQDGLDNFLNNMENLKNVKGIAIEEYRVYGHVNHIGSKVETVQVIGQIKAVARRHRIEVTEIPASDKRIAAKWAGVKIPKGHMDDALSAYLIGYYYLHYIKKVIKPRLVEEYTPNED